MLIRATVRTAYWCRLLMCGAAFFFPWRQLLDIVCCAHPGAEGQDPTGKERRAEEKRKMDAL